MKFTAMDKKEVWLPVKGWVGLYEASNFGRIRSMSRWSKSRYVGKLRLNKGRVLLLCPDQKGYLRVCLNGNGILRKNKKVHRLVADAHIQNPNNFPQVNHKDGDKKNNRVENLEWCDNEFNVKHKVLNGLHKTPKGEDCCKAILTQKEVFEIRAKYKFRVYTGRMLANEYGVHFTTISKIITNHNWRQP